MISIYRTSVNDVEEIGELAVSLDELAAVVRWNFDLEDCDKILRIESTVNVAATVTETLGLLGFVCEELE